MTLKKSRNMQTSSCQSNLSNFRTIVKNRINKQTIKDVVHLSVTLQQSIQQDDKRSVKSTLSVHRKSELQINESEKLKKFVRNMKFSCQQPTAVKVPKTIQNRQLSESRASIYSVKSNRSRDHNFVSMYLEKDIPDNKSVVSNKSFLDGESMSKSKLVFGKQNQESNKEKMLTKLNKMEQRMDYLLKNKLKNLMMRARSKHRYNPKPFLGARSSSTQADETLKDNLLQKQMQSILTAIVSLKQRDSEENLSLSELEENVGQLDKKIELLQKILASNFTQAQILRKFYFAQKSQKCPHLSRKEKILQEISKRKEMLKTNMSMMQSRDLKNRTPIIKYESSSKYFYTKPSHASYNNLKHIAKPFAPNNQPMPRSSYGRQFLNYGTLPVFNYKPHDSKYSTSKLNVKTSNYQEAFKEKHLQMKQINYKELDCFKDKLKTGSISFSEMYKNKTLIKKKTIENLTKNNQSHQQQKQNKKSVQKAMDTLQNLQKSAMLQTQSKFMGDTEMKRQFIWHTKDKSPQAKQQKYGKTEVIKNANLNNLKASFKMEFMR